MWKDGSYQSTDMHWSYRERGWCILPGTPAKLSKLWLWNFLISAIIIFPCCLSKIIAVTCFTAGVTANEYTEIKMHSEQRSHKEPQGFHWLLVLKTKYYIKKKKRNLTPLALILCKGVAQDFKDNSAQPWKRSTSLSKHKVQGHLPPPPSEIWQCLLWGFWHLGLLRSSNVKL